jgi:Na+-transporting methylmalonyl-CoA/oxaloacetate decarboxylase gamma subunit
MNELMTAGLTLTIVGMGLVFAGLALLWALVVLLGRLFPEHAAAETTALRTPAPDAAVSEGPLAVIVPLAPPSAAAAAAAPAMPAAPARALEAALSPEEALTAERARVAALVAGALLANALPIRFDVPTGPVFEHGRTAPLWVAANRARALPAWQPARRPDIDRNSDSLA